MSNDKISPFKKNKKDWFGNERRTDEYKSKLKEVQHLDFAKTDQSKVKYQNLLMGLSFIRDCNSGNATVKLSVYETKLLLRFTKLIKELKEYKEDHYEQRQN